jgi:hypothetical protein
MGRKIKFTIVFVVVFIAGCLTGAVLTSIQFNRIVVAPSYNISLLEIASDARLLSQGKAEVVLKEKVMAIPSLTQVYYNHYYKFMPHDDSRYASLWQVKRYYEISGQDIPVEIKSILESLPERPLTSCELKRSRDGNAPAACKAK